MTRRRGRLQYGHPGHPRAPVGTAVAVHRSRFLEYRGGRLHLWLALNHRPGDAGPAAAPVWSVRPTQGGAMTNPRCRLVIVVRADPVICGHAGEARNLAEVALTRGFDDVRLLTWPIPMLEAAGLPLKPLERLLPYSAGITVERPEPVGDYRVPDGRYQAGLTGRLVELLAEPVPTTCLSMYLAPHDAVVRDAVDAVRAAGHTPDVRTIAKAVGSDVTNVIRSCLRDRRFGAAVVLFTRFLANDQVTAVSEYTRQEIIAAAEAV